MTCKTDPPVQTLSQFPSLGSLTLRLLFPRLLLLQRLLNDSNDRMSTRKLLLFLQYPSRWSLLLVSPFLKLRGLRYFSSCEGS
jgi:hypothetical protein